MFLSIIIPHYNLPKELLERCIESIAKQDIPPGEYEVIVVDDASENVPTWIEEQYTGIDIRLVAAEHGGPGAARNRGIEEARGEYIEFVDADDLLMPDCGINSCLDMLRKQKPHILGFEYKVCTSPSNAHGNRKKKITFSETMSGAEYMRDFNLSGSPCKYFFQRALAIEKGVRFPVNILHEDEEFNTILHFHATSLIKSDALLYCYCIREGSTTANSSAAFEEKRIEDMLCVIERIGAFRDKNIGKCSKVQAKGLEHKLTMLAVDAIVNMMHTGMSAGTIHRKCRERLAPLGIYPLPQAPYSTKYRIFRLFANNSAGLHVLRAILPSKKPIDR